MMPTRRRDLEGAEQRALFQWAKLAEKKYPELKYLFHVPNGRLRDKITAAKLKAEGVKSGVPDIFLDVARRGYHGLRIELKASGGRLKPAQNDWLYELTEQGYFAEECYGWESALDVIEWYLSE